MQSFIYLRKRHIKPLNPRRNWKIDPTIIAPWSSLIICLNFCTQIITDRHWDGDQNTLALKWESQNISDYNNLAYKWIKDTPCRWKYTIGIQKWKDQENTSTLRILINRVYLIYFYSFNIQKLVEVCYKDTKRLTLQNIQGNSE